MYMHTENVMISCYYVHSPGKAVDILIAYEGTLEEDYPPDNERYEHSEMLLYKVSLISWTEFFLVYSPNNTIYKPVFSGVLVGGVRSS